MPSRLLREGILDSEAVNKLSFPAEVFYRRLMSVVDDFGRFDGRAAVLKGRLYALRPTVRESDITHWIAECETAGLVLLYTADNKPYLLFAKLGPARAASSKYPAPPPSVLPFPPVDAPAIADESGRKQVKTDVINRLQMKSPVPYSDSDSDSGSGSGSGSEYCSEPPKPAASEQPVLIFPCVGDGLHEWHLTSKKLAEWQATYPGIDALAEARKARQWLIDNPTRRKTHRGMPKFLNGWLGRAQDSGKGKVVPGTTALPKTSSPRLDGIAAVVAAQKALTLAAESPVTPGIKDDANGDASTPNDVVRRVG